MAILRWLRIIKAHNSLKPQQNGEGLLSAQGLDVVATRKFHWLRTGDVDSLPSLVLTLFNMRFVPVTVEPVGDYRK